MYFNSPIVTFISHICTQAFSIISIARMVLKTACSFIIYIDYKAHVGHRRTRGLVRNS